MKEIKRYLYYSPEVDVKYPDSCQLGVCFLLSDFLYNTVYIGGKGMKEFKFYYIGEY